MFLVSVKLQLFNFSVHNFFIFNKNCLLLILQQGLKTQFLYFLGTENIFCFIGLKISNCAFIVMIYLTNIYIWEHSTYNLVYHKLIRVSSSGWFCKVLINLRIPYCNCGQDGWRDYSAERRNWDAQAEKYKVEIFPLFHCALFSAWILRDCGTIVHSLI